MFEVNLVKERKKEERMGGRKKKKEITIVTMLGSQALGCLSYEELTKGLNNVFYF